MADQAMATGSGHTVQSESGGELGPRRLTTIHAIGQALGVGPIFSAGAVTGLVASVAFYNTPLSIVLGDIGALGIAYVISLYARRFAGAGAMYEYLARGVHNGFGIFSGGVYLCGALMLGSGGIYLGLCFLVQGFFAAHLHANIPWWAGGLAGLLVAWCLNHFGVRLAVRAVLTMAGLSSIPFIIMSIAIIVQGGDAGNTWAVFNPGESSTHDLLYGILFAILLFVGFEAAASIAEEMHAPREGIPVAIIGTVFVCCLFFLLVCYAATIGFGKTALLHNAWAGSPDAMGGLATRYVGSWLGVLVDLGVIFDALSLGIAIMVTSSRLFFAFARDGLLPKWIAKTSRYNTPLAGNLILAGWGGLFLIWTAATPYAPTGLGRDLVTFGISASAGSFLVETIYVFLGIFALRIVWTEFKGVWPRAWRLIAVGVGIAAPILAFYGSLSPFPAEPAAQSVWIWIAGGVLSLAWLLFLLRRRPAEVRAAAAYAAASAEAPVDVAGVAGAQPAVASD